MAGPPIFLPTGESVSSSHAELPGLDTLRTPDTPSSYCPQNAPGSECTQNCPTPMTLPGTPLAHSDSLANTYTSPRLNMGKNLVCKVLFLPRPDEVALLCAWCHAASSIRAHTRRPSDCWLSCQSPPSSVGSSDPLLCPAPCTSWLLYKYWREIGEREGGGEEEWMEGLNPPAANQLRIRAYPCMTDLRPCCGSSGGHWFLHLHSGSQGAGSLGIRRKEVR